MKHSYKLLFGIFATVLSAQTISAQCISCGTGSDGSYHATANTTLAGGTYNYTSFTIDPLVTVVVTGNSPLVIYCSGAVNIDGMLNASGGDGTNGITSDTNGVGGIGVAGGYNGGNGVYSSSTGPLDGTDGGGAGSMATHGSGWSGGGGAGYGTAGNASGGVGGFAGAMYGNAMLTTIDGGSGGGGGSGGYSCGSGGGGAGGGVIVISSCNSISIGPGANILANGGNGGTDGTGNCGGGGGGSGGMIYLGAPVINNSGIVAAVGGTGGASTVPGNPYYGTGADGAGGRIRFDYTTLNGGGSVNPGIGFTGTPVGASSTHTDESSAAANDGTATASGSGGVGTYTYLWAPGGQTTSMITGLDAGTYTCTVTDSLGCTDTTIATVGTASGILSHNSNSFDVQLYPNPANDMIHFSFTSNGNENAIIEVYNVVGEKVNTLAAPRGTAVNVDINTTALENGVYFFRISSNGNSVTKRVTVSH